MLIKELKEGTIFTTHERNTDRLFIILGDRYYCAGKKHYGQWNYLKNVSFINVTLVTEILCD